jgi:hypothetical protein
MYNFLSSSPSVRNRLGKFSVLGTGENHVWYSSEFSTVAISICGIVSGRDTLHTSDKSQDCPICNRADAKTSEKG